MKKKEWKKLAKALDQDLRIMDDYCSALEDQVEDLKRVSNARHDTIEKMSNHIALLNGQLDQQDKAIERKDAQWLGLRSAFQDALINNQA